MSVDPSPTRRAFLAVCAAASAGCLGSPSVSTPSLEALHPLANAESTVRTVDESDTPHDVAAITAEAVAFWSGEGAGYIPFDFDLRVTDDAEADIEVVYVDDLAQCGEIHDEGILGCAPLLGPGDRPREIVAYVLAGDRPYGRILTTTKHELGHVLGLDHDDEPLYIMSNDPRVRIPLFDLRLAVWEAYIDARGIRGEGIDRFNAAVGAWNGEAYDEAAERFQAAADRYEVGRAFVGEAMADVETLVAGGDETVDAVLVTYFEDLEAWFALAVDIATEMREASLAMAEGRTDEAGERFEAAQAHLDQQATIELATSNQVGVAVGLDDPVGEG